MPLKRTATSRAFKAAVGGPIAATTVGRLGRALGRDLRVLPIERAGQPVDGWIYGSAPAIRTVSRIGNFLGDYGPRHPGTRTTQRDLPFLHPGIGYRTVRNAVVQGRFPAAVTPDRVALPLPEGHKQYTPNRRNTPGFQASGPDLVAIDLPRVERRIESAVLLTGRHVANWYHWLLGGLPRVWMSSRLPSPLDGAPLLIYAPALSVPAIRQSLDMLTDGREVIAIGPEEFIRVDELTLLDGIEVSVQPASSSDELPAGPLALHGPATSAFRQLLLDIVADVGLGDGPAREKLFIKRPQPGNRPYNQDEVESALADRGYAAVGPHTLSFIDQLRAFNSARFIVGPTGGGWASLLSAEHCQMASAWYIDRWLSAGDIWSNLAVAVGSEFAGLAVPAPEGIEARRISSHGRYTVPVRPLIESLQRLGMA